MFLSFVNWSFTTLFKFLLFSFAYNYHLAATISAFENLVGQVNAELKRVFTDFSHPEGQSP